MLVQQAFIQGQKPRNSGRKPRIVTQRFIAGCPCIMGQQSPVGTTESRARGLSRPYGTCSNRGIFGPQHGSAGLLSNVPPGRKCSIVVFPANRCPTQQLFSRRARARSPCDGTGRSLIVRTSTRRPSTASRKFVGYGRRWPPPSLSRWKPRFCTTAGHRATRSPPSLSRWKP